MPFTSSISKGIEHYFPGTVFDKTTACSEREEYLNNYSTQKFKSLVLLLASSALGTVAIIKRKDPPLALSALITSIGLVTFWYLRPNDPVNLCKAAYSSMNNYDQANAIRIIKKGASLFAVMEIDRSKTASELSFLKFEDRWIRYESGLVEFALQYGSIEVINYLISIRYDFSKPRWKDRPNFLEIAPSRETADILLAGGAPLSSPEFNPLERQLFDLAVWVHKFPELYKKVKESHNAAAERIKAKCELVRELIESNQLHQSNFSNPWVNCKIGDLQNKVNELTLADSTIKKEIKDLLGQIGLFLNN